jgi:hypothetical protein
VERRHLLRGDVVAYIRLDASKEKSRVVHMRPEKMPLKRVEITFVAD